MVSYTNLTINEINRTFYIVEASSKPKGRNSALQALMGIERILIGGFSYDRTREDAYSRLSSEDLLKTLKEKSIHIQRAYTDKQAKRNWIARKVFSREKEVNYIQNKITPPESLGRFLPSDLIVHEIGKYLSVKELMVFAQLNKKSRGLSREAILLRAKELGFIGHDTNKGFSYIKELALEIAHLRKKRIILEKGAVEIPLKNLKALPSEALRKIFSSDQPYPRLFIHLYNKEKIGSDAAIRYLEWAFDKDDDSVLEFFSKERKALDEEGNFPLHMAVKMNNLKAIKLFLARGADINAMNKYEGSPLHAAAGREFINVMELLLAHGADSNLKNHAGNSPLHIVSFWGNEMAIKLLLAHGADRSAKNNKGKTPMQLAWSRSIKDLLRTAIDCRI